MDEFLYRETFFTCEKFPYGTFRTYLSKTRLVGRKTLGRCPNPCKPLKRFDPNFICLRRFLWGIAPNPTKGMIPLEPHLPTAFYSYLFSAKAKAFANRVKGVTPLQGS